MTSNLLELQEMLRNLDMGSVQQVAQGQSGKAAQLLGMDEIKRRGEQMQEVKAEEAEQGMQKPPMVDEFLAISQQMMGQAAPMPPQMAQGMPPQMPQRQQGIGSMMPQAPMPQPQMPPQMPMGQPPQQMPPQMMASGGSVGDPKVMASLDSQYQSLLNLDAEKQRYVALVREEAIRRGMDPDRAVAQIMQESRFDPNAISPAPDFAKGLAQFMDATRPEVGLEDPFNPEEAVRAYGEYQSRLNKRYPDDPARQLASYNAGMGRVDREFGSEDWDVPEADDYIARIAGLTDRIKAGQQGLSRSLKPTGQESNNPLADLSSEQLSAMYTERGRREGGGLLGKIFPSFGVHTESGLKQRKDIANELSRRSEEGNLTDRELYDLRSEVLLGDAGRTDEQFDRDQKRRAAASAVSGAREGIVKNIERNAATLSGPQKPVPWEGGALPIDPATFAAPGAPQTVPMTDELMEQIVATSGDPIRSVNEEGSPGGKGSPGGNRNLQPLFDFMMRSGLEYASGKNIGEAGIAGLGATADMGQQRRENARAAAADELKTDLTRAQISDLESRQGLTPAEAREKAIEELTETREIALMQMPPAQMEALIQQTMMKYLPYGSMRQPVAPINTEQFDITR